MGILGSSHMKIHMCVPIVEMQIEMHVSLRVQIVFLRLHSKRFVRPVN